MSKGEKVDSLSDEEFIETEKKSAVEYMSVAAKDFNEYEDFVQAKIDTLTDTIVCVFSHSTVPEDREILKAMQIKWIYDFWATKREKSLNLEN
ncbi:hypothetical protein OAT10_00085 [Luminiphilus sp.]|nr:hypothetical protein [Luminiphilus sp.]